MTIEQQKAFMREAIELSRKGSESGKGGPFGAVIVKDNQIVGRGYNQVTSTHDPTAHAEVMAIRNACQNLNTFHLPDCTIFTSCEPCPMCLGAIYWAKIKHIYYANTRKDAAAIGFNDDFIYQEFNVPIENRKIPTEPFLREEANIVFQHWHNKDDKINY
jgi:guanine deaminase